MLFPFFVVSHPCWALAAPFGNLFGEYEHQLGERRAELDRREIAVREERARINAENGHLARERARFCADANEAIFGNP